MEFCVSEDQAALRAGIAEFCEGRLPLSTLLELCQAPLDRALWSEIAELGVFSLRIPEAKGGLGLGMAEGVLVFAELGSRLVPGPLVWSSLVASLLPGVEAGTHVVTGLDRIRASSDPILVEHLDGSDILVVLEAGGVRTIATSDLKATPIETPLDPLTPLHLVDSLPTGEKIGDGVMSRKLRAEGALLTAALQLGIAEATLQHASEYALKREQFNRPIGSFQAIKHFLADMLTRREQASGGGGCAPPPPPGGGGVFAPARHRGWSGGRRARASRRRREADCRRGRPQERAPMHPDLRRNGVRMGSGSPPVSETRTRPRERLWHHGRVCRSRGGTARESRGAVT